MTQPNTDQPQPERGWRERAVCRDVDPELFFPVAEAGPVRDTQTAAAKAVCARCPVVAQCLTEALARIPYGIAGGLTEDERRGLRTSSTARPGPRLGRSAATPREVSPGGPDRELNRRERAEVGRELLAAGRALGQVASACRVSVRTVERWAAHTRANTNTGTATQHDMGEGSRGGNRAPLQISTAHDTHAGTRAPEGLRG